VEQSCARFRYDTIRAGRGFPSTACGTGWGEVSGISL
jgi:hypothetical protein